MWKYANQIKIRWASFILGLIVVGLFLVYFRNDISFTQTGMKVFLTRVQVGFENLSILHYAAIIMGSILLLLVGVPSVCVVLPLMLMVNGTFAYVVACICQIVSSLFAMWISYKSSPLVLSEELEKKLLDNKDNYQSFAFWSRLYFNIPLRTIDRLTPNVHNNEFIFLGSLIPAASAIMIRICIPTMLIKHIVDQFTLLEPNPELEYTKFFVWAIVFIVYTLIPKVPELMICPKKVKKVIYEIESPTEKKAD